MTDALTSDERCDRSALDEVERAALALERDGRLGLTRGFIQHGTVSVYEHVRSVARACELTAPPSFAARCCMTIFSMIGMMRTPRIVCMGSRIPPARSPGPRRISSLRSASEISSPVICFRWCPCPPLAAKHGLSAWRINGAPCTRRLPPGCPARARAFRHRGMCGRGWA